MYSSTAHAGVEVLVCTYLCPLNGMEESGYFHV